MSAYGKIIQNLTKKIEVLMNNGDNHNGQIDTTNEKNELAHLLSGAEQEIEDLYTKMINGLDNQAANISKKNYDVQYNKLENEKKNAMNMIDNIDKSLMELNAFEERRHAIVGPDSVQHKYGVFKVRANNSYEEKLNDSENSFNVVVRDKDGNEIGRKSYTKSKKGIYTNKETVAKNCGLSTKKSIDDFKTGKLERMAETALAFVAPFGASHALYLFENEDNDIEVLSMLNDDEALDLDSSRENASSHLNGSCMLYKWNPKTNEYEKVGSIPYSPKSGSHYGNTLEWGKKSYDNEKK